TSCFLNVVFSNGNSLAPLHTPLHPVQIYEAVLDFLLFLYLRKFYKRRTYSGAIFVRYLAFYSVIRFCMEFLRDDTVFLKIFPYLTGIQLLCLLSLLLIVYLTLKWKKEG
ncbi:MAG TPA: prolipoprotein diacylglyceryl transferase family protein, partial [bacterium]|nr:prolipoprotein diacylglyceryl transferase family protein [bacterium]